MIESKIRRDLLPVCEDFLDTVSDDVVEYVEDWRANDTSILELDWSDLDAFEDGVLTRDYRRNPAQVNDHLEMALTSFATDADEGRRLRSDTTIRFVGYDDEYVYDVGQYRPEEVTNELIHLRGQVTRRSKRKLKDEVIAFECVQCGNITRVEQSGKKFREPHECPSEGCGSKGPWQIDDRKSYMRGYQSIRFQTLPEHSQRGESEHITLRLYDDLVGDLNPGDRAVLNVEMVTMRQKKTRVRELEGVVYSITKLESDHQDVDIEPYEDEIREIADDPYEDIIESVAPFHEGDEHIKEAIAYQLFGGVEKELPDGSWMRGNSHILLMGDPGTGKTSIIRYVSNIVPRSEYATGKQSTSAGLTASAVKDDFAEGGWSLQAGTLVKAHNGLAAIDELDKMEPDDRDGMIEAMSEQQITVNMVASGVLPARTSVLAAANPKYGSFNPMQDIGNQLDLDSVLLSRFDLWFVMVDEPEEDLDEDIASTMTDTATAGQKIAGGQDMSEVTEDHTEPPITPEMFRAYIAMAKQCFPVFTDDAKDRIVSEYVKIRQLNGSDGPIPTTARIVEAMHRLSEASARMRLADEVTEEDVERAINIQRESLESMGVDPETGDMDAMRMENGGTPTSKADRTKALEGIIRGQESEEEAAAKSEVKEEAMILMDEDDYDECYKTLKKRDIIYEPSPHEVRTL